MATTLQQFELEHRPGRPVFVPLFERDIRYNDKPPSEPITTDLIPDNRKRPRYQEEQYHRFSRPSSTHDERRPTNRNYYQHMVTGSNQELAIPSPPAKSGVIVNPTNFGIPTMPQGYAMIKMANPLSSSTSPPPPYSHTTSMPLINSAHN